MIKKGGSNSGLTLEVPFLSFCSLHPRSPCGLRCTEKAFRISHNHLFIYFKFQYSFQKNLKSNSSIFFKNRSKLYYLLREIAVLYKCLKIYILEFQFSKVLVSFRCDVLQPRTPRTRNTNQSHLIFYPGGRMCKI